MLQSRRRRRQIIVGGGGVRRRHRVNPPAVIGYIAEGPHRITLAHILDTYLISNSRQLTLTLTSTNTNTGPN